MDPEEIENREFLVTLRGYARDEVNAFREEVAQEVASLRKQVTKATSELSETSSELSQARSRLSDTESQLTAVRAELAEERSRAAAAPAEQQAKEEPKPVSRSAAFKMVGQETERILQAAEQVAEQIHERATRESAEIMADARAQVQRAMAELAEARRAAEEDFAGIKDARRMVASQLEDIGRRLDETISRLQVPVDLPGPKGQPTRRPGNGTGGGAVASQAASPGRVVSPEAQAQAHRARQEEAARELQVRQTAHKVEAERREAEMRARESEIQRRSQAEAASNAVRAAATAKAREEEEHRRAQAAEAERAAKAEAAKAEAAKAEAAKAEAAKAEAAKAEAAKAEAERVAKAKAEAAKAEAERVAKAEAAKAEARKAEAVRENTRQSSLDELLEEIRRKREDERHSPAEVAAQPETNEPKATEPAVTEAEPDRAGSELSGRDRAMGDLPVQTARRLKRLLQEDHNDLLDRLRTMRGKGDLDDNLPPPAEQLGRFRAGLNESLSRAFAVGHRAGGVDADGDPSAVVGRIVSRQVLKPLRTEVSRAIEAGLAAQDSTSALSERVNDVFRVWKGVRTQLLGEGIAQAAYHQGLLEAWGSRAGAKKFWVPGEEDECPNEVCRRNAEVGAVGLKAAFPSGHISPPAHGGCTCTLRSA